MTTSPRPLALTTRDLDILQLITQHRIVLVEDLAARFFAFDPITKKPNTDPLRACERRLKTGCAHGAEPLTFRYVGTLFGGAMKTTSTPPMEVLVGAAEAAFIADLDPKDLHRVVDESVLPDDLMERSGARQFARLGAAIARFYFDTAEALSKATRLEIIEKVMERLRPRENLSAVLSLAGPLSSIDWSVHSGYLTVDLRPAVEHAAERAARARNAVNLVVEDPDILGGRPAFRGTRVPIDVAIGAPTTGARWKRLQESYPFLTEDHVDAANVYAVIRPRRGRPAKVERSTKGWKVKSTRRIPPTGA